MAEQTPTVDDLAIEHPIPAQDAPRDPALARRMLFWRLIIVGTLLVFVWFLAVGLQRQTASQRRAIGSAPELSFTTFEGETVHLSDLQGKGVVINFWASWCDPCRAEAAMLEAAWRREQPKGIVFLGLDYLDQEHSALAYLAEYDITYPNGPDLQSEAARRYGIQGVPETFFITPEGQIASVVIGPVLSEADLAARLAEIRPAP